MLRPHRQIEWKTKTHPRYLPGERGGLISYVQMSGVDFSMYADTPSGNITVGVQLYDVIEEDEYYNIPRVQGQVQQYTYEEIDVVLGGEIETNFIHPDSANEIHSGKIAYAGPSGMFTHDSSFGGQEVGIFLGDLDTDEKEVLVQGGGYYYDKWINEDDGTYYIADVGFPRKTVTTPGYARIRLDIRVKVWS